LRANRLIKESILNLDIKNFNDASYLSILILSIISFLTFSTYVAFKLPKSIAPDEAEHIRIIQYQSKLKVTEIFLVDHKDLISYGPLEHRPPLFYFLSSLWLRLKPSNFNEIIHLRIINLIWALAGIVFALKLILFLDLAPRISLILAVLVLNTPMITFISGTVNYDNLANLFAWSSIYYMLKSIDKPGSNSFVLFVLCSLSGTLSKVTNIPLLLACLTCLGFENYHNKKIDFFSKSFISWIKTNWLLTTILILLTYGNTKIYVSSTVKFGTPLPSCEKIWDKDKCEKNSALYRRDKELTEELKEHPRLDLHEYLIEYLALGEYRLFGIFGHKSYEARSYYLYIINTLFFIGIIFFPIGEVPTKFRYMLIVFLIYMTFLIFQNFFYYRELGAFGVAVQGRYWTPTFTLFLASVFFGLSKIRNSLVRDFLLIGIAILSLTHSVNIFLNYFSILNLVNMLPLLRLSFGS
jgi:hypothetical protein